MKWIHLYSPFQERLVMEILAESHSKNIIIHARPKGDINKNKGRIYKIEIKKNRIE